MNKSIPFQEWGVDENYIPTLEIQVISGRNFSSSIVSDSGAVIINEAAAKFVDENAPLTKMLYVMDDIKNKKVKAYRIIGVVKNFHFNTLRERITPLALMLKKESGSVALRVVSKDFPGLLRSIEDEWQSIEPALPFNYSFLDEKFNSQYQSEERIANISVAFSVVAILVACMGLFGLVTYAAERRVKEIGIRKVLGANITQILALLSKEFMGLVVLAIMVACPIAYWIMSQWLQDFVYRVSISWLDFVLAGGAGMLIAMITLSYQAVKSALANPITSLRTE
jgi:putative ABC transport system permease protein